MVVSEKHQAIGRRIRRARSQWNLSQRKLTAETGISQATLSRIENGTRPAQMNEVLSLAWALGYTVRELTGHSPVRDRLQCTAFVTDGANMREELIHFLELDAFLEEQEIEQPA